MEYWNLDFLQQSYFSYKTNEKLFVLWKLVIKDIEEIYKLVSLWWIT